MTMGKELSNITDAEPGRVRTEIQLACFRVGDQMYSLDILRIKEVIRPLKLTPVPKAPVFIEGVINLRGKVVPVIQLRKRFGHPLMAHDNNTRIIVVEVQGRILGMIVDSVSEVIRIPASTIEPPPDIIAGVDSEYIKGVGKLEKRLLILLDLDKVLTQVDVELTAQTK